MIWPKDYKEICSVSCCNFPPSVWLLQSPGLTVGTALLVPELPLPVGDELCPSVAPGLAPARELSVRAAEMKMTGMVKTSFKYY